MLLSCKWERPLKTYIKTLQINFSSKVLSDSSFYKIILYKSPSSAYSIMILKKVNIFCIPHGLTCFINKDLLVLNKVWVLEGSKYSYFIQSVQAFFLSKRGHLNPLHGVVCVVLVSSDEEDF
jgi:hypothetical protein